MKSRKLLSYLVIVGIGVLYALDYKLFILPNRFAPAGINGICTMIQYIFGINMGYLNLIINIPLAVAVYFLVSKPLALRAFTFVCVFSAALVMFDYMDLSAFVYSTDNGTSTILGPLAGGIIGGYCSSMLVKAGSHAGGTDFVSSLIHSFRPDINFFWISFALNAVVAVCSYFVYGYQIEPVLLCIIYCFSVSSILDKLAKSGRSAVRFEIITDHPDEIGAAIIRDIHHSATLIPAKGMYKGRETNMLICVVNKTQVAAVSAILRGYPNTFAIMSQVNEVMGNFRRLDNRGKPERDLLDHADTNIG